MVYEWFFFFNCFHALSGYWESVAKEKRKERKIKLEILRLWLHLRLVEDSKFLFTCVIGNSKHPKKKSFDSLVLEDIMLLYFKNEFGLLLTWYFCSQIQNYLIFFLMSLWNMFELVILFFSSPIFEGLDIWLHFSMCQSIIYFFTLIMFGW